ncbi:unnamed protein product [Peronospora effusa]|uniref:Uncharacterized protein n=1 Tax=Peronospora effusa TaxID=542832 RepID=A0A3M6VQE5_9STRA|nr:hypothetical protein DD238_005049 [Peronospora effusa]RQM14958.1 hypothetical protein DD237_005689 [Peronospora effusa]CAI5703600.1 unnamed protein product [Peronospora effusa]
MEMMEGGGGIRNKEKERKKEKKKKEKGPREEEEKNRGDIYFVGAFGRLDTSLDIGNTHVSGLALVESGSKRSGLALVESGSKRFRSVIVMQMQTPEHDDDTAKLREQLRHLEQENDDLQSCVRRLKATEEDLSHKIERAEEEAVFAQQELEICQENHEQSDSRSAEQIHDLTAKLQEYQNVVSRLLSVVGIPNETQATGKSLDVEENELELKPCNENTDDTGKANARKVDENNGHAAQFVSDQKWIDMVESLRTEMQTQTEQLQTVEDNYEEFMVASYEVEKALASENTDLKHFIAELQTENAHLQHLLQTERDS